MGHDGGDAAPPPSSPPASLYPLLTSGEKKMKKGTAIALNATKMLAIAATLALLAKAVFVSDRVLDMVGDTRTEAKTSASFEAIYKLTSSAEAGLHEIQGKIILGSSLLTILALLPWARVQKSNTGQAAP